MDKVKILKKLRETSKYSIEEVVRKALNDTNELKPYVISIIKYNGTIPTFKNLFGTFKNSAEAARYAIDKEELDDNTEEDSPDEFKSGILKISRVFGADLKYTEKDMLNAWAFILEHIRMGDEYVDGLTVFTDNKGSIVEELSEKYGIRANNYLKEVYKRPKHHK